MKRFLLLLAFTIPSSLLAVASPPSNVGPRALVSTAADPLVAVIVDTLLYAPGNIPPIRNDLTFTLVAIDDQPIARELRPARPNGYPGVVVLPGVHRFRVAVAPIRKRAGDTPGEATFTASVEAGKRYYVVSREGLPALPTLLEANSSGTRRP